MNIFNRLSEKPWLHQSTVDDYQPISHDSLQPKKIALRFFIAVVCVLFSLFTITFLSRSQYGDFQALSGEPWQPFTNDMQLWINTLILLGASASLHLGFVATKKGRIDTSMLWILLAGFLSFAFVFAQVKVWGYLWNMGYYINTNPANSFYYLFTAIHGLHLLGGIFVLTRVLFDFWRGAAIKTISDRLSLCVTYWHFLGIVWLFLFFLLTASMDTFNKIAAVCGF